ncbi:hypothetical protein SCP_1102330 [Sparassis crispa]|uniref:Uncharacterized protein n=1 Tax=Sparassis crispa TaxID=139825 RepID=A0A401GZF1_9APHY|nr:hypothetical protein SCP_1102330 [Sparassis crispa]GBE87556.1 hypothetical protein SCP_1102330 [Sparassis crispa]
MEELCNCFQNTTTPSSVIIGLDRERRRSEIICQPVSGGSCRDPETDGDFFGSFLTAELSFYKMAQICHSLRSCFGRYTPTFNFP